MPSDNPFDAPRTDRPSGPVPPTGEVPNGRVTEAMLTYLRRARPWQGFIAGLLGLATALLSLIVVFMLVAGLIGVVTSGEPSRAVAALGGMLYALVALLYGYPAYALFKTAAAARRVDAAVLPTDTESALEDVLRHQAAFWRFLGISAIVIIAIYLVIGVIVCLVAGVGGAASQGW